MRKRVSMLRDRVVEESFECRSADRESGDKRKKDRARRRRKRAKRWVVQGMLLRMCCCRIGLETHCSVEVEMSWICPR